MKKNIIILIALFFVFGCKNPAKKIIESDGFIEVKSISGVPTTAYVDIPLQMTGTVEPENAVNTEIEWSVKNAGDTGAEFDGDAIIAKAAGILTLSARVASGLGDGIDFTRDFFISVLEEPASIILSMDNFSPTDTGSGVFIQTAIVLNKASSDIKTAEAPAGSINVVWHLGNIELGTGNSLTLNAGHFNAGTFTLYCTFTIDGKPWMGSFLLTVE